MEKETPSAAATMAVLGALSQVGPVISFGGTIWGMAEAFEVLGAKGVGDPAKLSAAIGEVIIASTVGMLIGLAGLILLVLAITVFRYRAPWVFWFLMAYGVVLLLMFPFGTLFGLFFLIYCSIKREEFLCIPKLA